MLKIIVTFYEIIKHPKFANQYVNILSFYYYIYKRVFALLYPRSSRLKVTWLLVPLNEISSADFAKIQIPLHDWKLLAVHVWIDIELPTYPLSRIRCYAV